MHVKQSEQVGCVPNICQDFRPGAIFMQLRALAHIELC